MAKRAIPVDLFNAADPMGNIDATIGILVEPWLSNHELGDEILFHYTTLEGLQKIVEGRSLKLSHISLLNDPAELLYGKDLIKSEISKLLGEAGTDPAQVRLLEKLLVSVDSIGGVVPGLTHQFFITCFCTDGNLLSQWRAYSQQGRGYSLGFTFTDQTRYSPDGSMAEEIVTVLRKVIYDVDTQVFHVGNCLRWMSSLVKEPLPHPSLRVDESQLELAMLARVTEYSLCFKSPMYQGESEWRFIRFVPDGTNATGMDFDEAYGLLRPFRLTPIFDKMGGTDNRFPLSEIICGPALDPIPSTASIRLFLQKSSENGSVIQLGQVPVKHAGYRLRV